MKSRQQIIEANYRRNVSEKIYELLVIMAPGEQSDIGSLKYADLLAYAEKLIHEERFGESKSEDSNDGLTI